MLSAIMLSVANKLIRLSVIMLNVAMLSFVMLSVFAPIQIMFYFCYCGLGVNTLE